MEEAGFEVRDVESLREHYARTLRAWVGNLESHWDRRRRLVGERRARIWRLYMAGSALGFEDGGISVHQVLGVVPEPDGTSGMPRTRDGSGPPTRLRWPPRPARPLRAAARSSGGARPDGIAGMIMTNHRPSRLANPTMPNGATNISRMSNAANTSVARLGGPGGSPRPASGSHDLSGTSRVNWSTR